MEEKNFSALIKWVGGLAVAVIATATLWSGFKDSIINEIETQHQEDMAKIEERFICFNLHIKDADSAEHQACLDEFNRLRIIRRLKRANQ